jgi:Mg2+ and Co2+ transporter CorA
VSVDPKILEKSPLTPRQKDVLHRIDILKEQSTKVAKHYRVTRGTMSKCHNTALKRYNEFASLVKSSVADEAEKFQAKLDDQDEQLKQIFQILEHYSRCLGGLKDVADQIGPFRAKNCVHNVSGKCDKWPSLVVGPWTCGICVGFVDKEATDVIDALDTY